MTGATSGAPPTWPSTSPPPTRSSPTFPRYLQLKMPVVIGTTGWAAHAPRFREQAERAGLGVVASANFSIGVNIFQLVVAEAARLMQAQPQYGAWIHEAHHATKRDAPSGTALTAARCDGRRRVRPRDRHVVDAGRHDSRHSHRRIRRGLGYDRAFAHRARSPWVCRRCAGGREVDSRPAGVVHHGRRPADAAPRVADSRGRV